MNLITYGLRAYGMDQSPHDPIFSRHQKVQIVKSPVLGGAIGTTREIGGFSPPDFHACREIL